MKVFLNTSSTRPYHLSQDEHKEFTWHLGAIDSLVVMYLGEKYIGADKELGKNTGYMSDLVRFGLKKVDGLTDDNNNPIEMPTEEVDLPYVGRYKVVADSFLRKLMVGILLELSVEISKDNMLMGDQLKN